MEYALVVLWLVVYLALLLAGLPLANALFPRLADRGAGVAIPLSAALLWIVAYWVGHVSLDLALWAGLAILLGSVIALSYVREIDVDTGIVAETAGVFTLAFLLLVAMRAVDPAVHPIGGEKFLDFGLVKSILRTNALPPEDMWFAGEPVKYYYGGHLLAAMLTRLTGTLPRYAYNLALAGFYGMLVTAAYGLAGSIAAHRGTSRRGAGAFAAFFVGIASNLSTPAKAVLSVFPKGVATTLAGILSVKPDGVVTSLGRFNYWSASRVIEGTVNEFPFFSWLNGDLHAHMMSTPFLLLVAALLFSYYRTPAEQVRRRQLLVFGAVPPLAGLLAVVNTWSFPSVGGLAMLTAIFATAHPATLLPDRVGTYLRDADRWWRDELGRVVTAVGIGAATVLLGLLWSAPFWFGTASTRSIAFFPTRSPLGGLLLVHGGFLLVFVPYLLRHSLPRLEEVGKAAVMLVLLAILGLLSRAPAVVLFAPLIAVGWGLLRFGDVSIPHTRPATGTATSADGGRDVEPDGGQEPDVEDSSTVEDSDTGEDENTAAPESAVSEPESDTAADDGLLQPGFEILLLVAGAGIILLVEFAYVQEQAGPGRFNTVFKTYMQVWVLWAVAAGAALAHLVWNHRPSLSLSGGRWKPGFAVLAAVLLVSTSLYAGLAFANHFGSKQHIGEPDQPTLDALQFVSTEHAAEADAIFWLDENLEGQPNIVSAPGGYRWTPDSGKGANAPSSLTGIPTVVGWYHEIGYRGQEPYRSRKADVRAIYTGEPAQQADLLAEYDVEYIYVGPAERAKYGNPSFAGIEGISVAREWPEVTIYRVDQDQLGA
jgi:uncharacterized membrane protein